MILVGLLAPAGAEDWPAYRRDNFRSARSTDLVEAERLGLDWQWTSPLPPAPAWPGPAKWDSYAQIRGMKSMRNYDPVFHPVAADGRVYFGSSADDTLRCLALADGELQWQFTADGPIRCAPTVADARVYFGSDDGHAYCLDAADGRLLWKFRPGDDAALVLNNGRLISYWPCRSGVLVQDGTAYFACSLLPWKTSYLCAVDARTGKPEGEGRYVKSYEGLTIEGPMAATAAVLVSPQGRDAPRIYRRSDGTELGTLKGGGGSFLIVTEDARVLHGPGNKLGWITDSAAASGDELARHPNANSMLVTQNRSYMVTDTELIATDLSRKEVVFRVPCRHSLALASARETIFAGGMDEVAAYNGANGDLIWRQPVDGKVYGLAVAGGKLLVATDVGRLYVFDEQLPAAEAAAGDADLVESSADEPPGAPAEAFQHEQLLGRWVFAPPHVRNYRVDDLQGKSPGTIIGKRHLTAGGPVKALGFDGQDNSVMLAADHTQADLPQEKLTAEAWVCIDQPLAWGGIIGAIQDNGDFERGWLLGYRNNHFCLAVAAADGGGKLTYLDADEPFQLGGWHHVAGVYDGKQMRLYVDGREAASSQEQRGAIHYPPKAFYEIGAYHDDDEYYRLRGMIQEVRVYSAALTPAKIQRHYQHSAARLPSPASAAVGPWLQFTAPGEAVVRWRTDTPQQSLLELQLDGQSRAYRSTEPVTDHEVHLTGLKQGRVYEYQLIFEVDGATKVSPSYECDTHFNYSPPALGPADVAGDAAGEQTALAGKLLDQLESRRGLAVLLDQPDAQLALALAHGSDLRVIQYCKTEAEQASARARLLAAGAYGNRVVVLPRTALADSPRNFANLVIVGASKTVDTGLALARPDGGRVVLLGDAAIDRDPASPGARHDGFTLWRRGAMPTAGEWSHLYGKPNNTAFGGEALGGAKKVDDLEVQWIGRPGARYQADRSPRKPSPLSTSGRLFLQGLHRMIALDAYNGSILWSLELPHFERYNMPRDSSNWCADREFVYAVMNDHCWKIDAATGAVLEMLPVSAPDDGADYHWGYVARSDGMLIGSATRAAAAWKNFWSETGWYDATAGAATDKIASDRLFAVDPATSETRWTYEDGLILNTTITASEGKLYFVVSRDPALRAAASRRLGGEAFLKSLRLVAIDASTGKKQWEQPLDGLPPITVLYLAAAEGRLITVSSGGGQFETTVYDVANVDPARPTPAKQLWRDRFGWPSDNHGMHMSRPAVVGGRLFVRPLAFDLASGKRLEAQLPGGGCGTYACTQEMVVFRQGNITVWDQASGQASSWHRLRPDCWLSTIPAAGMLLSPEGGGGCSCGGWLEASVGFRPVKWPSPVQVGSGD